MYFVNEIMNHIYCLQRQQSIYQYWFKIRCMSIIYYLNILSRRLNLHHTNGRSHRVMGWTNLTAQFIGTMAAAEEDRVTNMAHIPYFKLNTSLTQGVPVLAYLLGQTSGRGSVSGY